MTEEEEILRQLKELSGFDEQSRNEVVFQHTPDNYYGIGVDKIKKLAYTIGKDHILAGKLWRSGLHEGKILATFLEQPRKVTEDQLDQQMKGIYTSDLVDIYCKNVAFQTPYVNAKIKDWTRSKEEFVKRAGYILVWLKAKKGDDFTDSDFEKYLEEISRDINSENNSVKEAMNFALISIGCKNRFLNVKALKIANEIGKINIKPTYISGKAPDARSVLAGDHTVSGIVEGGRLQE